MKVKIGFFVFVLILVLYAKSRFYDANHQIEIAKQEVKDLIENNELKDGDLIFQTSKSAQSQAIQEATNSKYSHCGIIFKEKIDYYVFEAVQPVKKTPLDKWIARGKNGDYVIKRLINSEQILTKEVVFKMKQVAKNMEGKNYDLTFEWSDDKIYCSELIWKIYQKSTGLELGKLQKLKDFNLDNKIVNAKLKERYGNNIPLNEIVISPSSIFESDLLTTIK